MYGFPCPLCRCDVLNNAPPIEEEVDEDDDVNDGAQGLVTDSQNYEEDDGRSSQGEVNEY